MEGPRRVSQSELRHAFADGWEIESLEPVRLEIRPEYRQQGAFSGEDPRGWFLIARRLGVGESLHIRCDPQEGYARVGGRRPPLNRIRSEETEEVEERRSKIRVAEIHLSKIAKLDRAEKRDSDAPVPELGPETEAPF
jgi:hypothetical protein